MVADFLLKRRQNDLLTKYPNLERGQWLEKVKRVFILVKKFAKKSTAGAVRS